MQYYYADEETAESLKSQGKRVYLYGGYIGYNNFGDILQLKGVIDYYKQTIGLDPIVVLSIGALEYPEQIRDFKRWYGCEHFIFLSDDLVDAGDANLYLVKSLYKGGLLHVYGGGILNKYWGKRFIEKIESILIDLKPANYLFSGQQVEEAIVGQLNALFKTKKPLVFGVRDRLSYEYMKQTASIPAKSIVFSFDDIVDIFLKWKLSSTPSVKLRLINKLRPDRVLWHINMSGYATTNKDKLLQKVRRVKKDHPTSRVVIAQAYNDIRLSLRDSMQSLLQLENDFPYYEYTIVNLAQMALDVHPEQNRFPNISSLLSNVNLAVTSSYHTAMLTTFFGIPSFLMSDNAFYTQKQRSLGFIGDFGKFMENPSINLNEFKQELVERDIWLEMLTALIQKDIAETDEKVIQVHEGLATSNMPQIAYRRPES